MHSMMSHMTRTRCADHTCYATAPISLMLIFIALGLVVSVLFYVINVLIYYTSRSSLSQNDLISTYECGFEALQNQARTEHSISYYIVALLYVIFDLEIAIILPALISISTIGAAGTVLLISVMSLLCLAFVYEFKLGTFDYINRLQ
jgi:NADH-quinone oxidoreductase subunit A